MDEIRDPFMNIGTPSFTTEIIKEICNTVSNNDTQCITCPKYIAKLLSLFHSCDDTTTRVVVSLVARLTANHLVCLHKPTLAEDSHCLVASLVSECFL